jgi:hypothetical protein
MKLCKNVCWWDTRLRCEREAGHEGEHEPAGSCGGELEVALNEPAGSPEFQSALEVLARVAAALREPLPEEEE